MILRRYPDVASIRRLGNLTQTELARAVGVSPNTISRWERDLMEPDAPNLCRLDGIRGLLEVQAEKERP